MNKEPQVRNLLKLLTGAASPKPRGSLFAAAAPAVPLPDMGWAFAEGVQALGLGEKETCGKILSEVALKLYVEKKKPTSAVDRPIPKSISVAGLPKIHTDVVEIGRIELQSNTQRIRPAIPGYSVGRALEPQEAGTFGMVVRKKGEASPFYLLSNSHAIAASGFANKGDAIIQPGGADGGTTADIIATLTQWIPFVFGGNGFTNTVDAAIAELTPGAASAAIAQLGVPKGINTALNRGDYVQKMGRTTTLSVGRIMDIDLQVPSTYPNGAGGLARVGFSDQVLVTFYSAGGDSGSPVLDMDSNVVGLHVAGSPVIGIFCKIANVMAQLGIEVVTQDMLGSAPPAAPGA
jgi:hypothetical protein